MVDMRITSSLFEAYLKCPTKCFLQSIGESSADNAYDNWEKTNGENYRNKGILRLKSRLAPNSVTVSSEVADLKTTECHVAVNFVARTRDLEASIDAVERIRSQGRGKLALLSPIRFLWRNKLNKDDKVLLGFQAFVLSEVLRRKVEHGKIIYGDDQTTLKVRTSSLAGEVRRLTVKIAQLLANPSAPELILNSHCAECEFHHRCRQKAIEKDDLSFLSSMSQKERTKLITKGIFTVTQLSYTYRPRRRPKRLKNKRDKYLHTLKALAIREKKIHIVGRPTLNIDGTPVYLDVEGLPDRDFYYLIGVRLSTGESVVQHSLWADTPYQEKDIWTQFLGILAGVQNPVVIHYGSFETFFLRKMIKRYGSPPESSVPANALQTAVNLLSLIYGQIYFPCYSNGLKDIARLLGFEWSEPEASGIMTVVWRANWEQSGAPSLKEKITTYNAEDCAALCQVTNSFRNLCTWEPESSSMQKGNIVFTDTLPRPSPFKFQNNEFAIAELKEINRAAYWDYQRERITLKTNVRVRKITKMVAKKAQTKPRINKVVQCPAPVACPICGGIKLYRHQAYSKIISDLRFGQSGIRRWVTKYLYWRYRCVSCGAVFQPTKKGWTGQNFYPNVRALSIYLNIDLRIPQMKVAAFLNQVFDFRFPRNGMSLFKIIGATLYRPTFERLLKKILRGVLIHADETQVKLKKNIGYVWVFTSLEEVVYIYAPTRRGDLVVDLLKHFKGVLVSDFYSAYDSLGCLKQKCLIHLIRDMNDDLLNEPFNEEIKSLVAGFAALLKPMIETINRFGLKTRFLRRHKKDVERFFRFLSRHEYHTETANRCKTRLEKNRMSLFTFLDYDGVPWNNNNAEHAVKAFAMLRRDFAGVSTENGVRDYLILLSVCETCRVKGVSFLDFLRSGEKDIDAFTNRWFKGRNHPQDLKSPTTPHR
jgi:predicted RecB family nuclease